MEDRKKCSKCGEVKALSEFHVRNFIKGLRTSQCKLCRKKHTILPNVKTPTVKEKVCTGCGQIKPASEYAFASTNKDGLQYRCKLCQSEYSEVRYKTQRTRLLMVGAAYRLANPEKIRDIRLRAECGISAAQYDKMFDDQRGLCAICLMPPGTRRLAVDHDHKTQKVRGLLCDVCNRGIGYFKENQESLLRSVEYLRKHNT